MTPHRQLSLALRIVAALDSLAVIAMAAPWSWIAAMARLTGFEVGETVPLVHYLTRTASGMYFVYGALLWYLSLDVLRFAPVIRFLSWVSILHSFAVLGVDLAVGMPLVWCAGEFLGHLAESIVLLCLLHRSNRQFKGSQPQAPSVA